jgi:folate-binding protein YgfZ
LFGCGQYQVGKIYQFLDKPLKKSILSLINFSTSPRFLRWQPAGWLQVSGADAADFLQGQFTQDLRPLARAVPGLAAPAVYGLWLNVKGKVLADSLVLREQRADGAVFWIGSYFSPASTIRERLESFVIADDVTFEDRTADVVGFSLIGDGVSGWTVAGFTDSEVTRFKGRRSRSDNVEWIVARERGTALEAGLEASGASKIDAATAEALRIAEGIPAVPLDLGPGDLPNEGGLEAEAISYTKGCYLGQEVMARLKAMGQVRRRLVRVRIAAAHAPIVPVALQTNERQVGEVRSVTRAPDGDGFIGFAMVSLLHVKSETVLRLGSDPLAGVAVLDPL